MYPSMSISSLYIYLYVYAYRSIDIDMQICADMQMYRYMLFPPQFSSVSVSVSALQSGICSGSDERPAG